MNEKVECWICKKDYRADNYHINLICKGCQYKEKQELIAEFIKKMEFIELYSKNPKLMAREYKIEYQKETSRG